jgi:alpha-D-ribose 1-methylphosphonate 5-triphosphate synthase subunit PhnL
VFTHVDGAFVGVIGPNGAGKTTLARMIAGQETPDAGSLKVGDTVQIAYVDQSRADLDPEKTVYEVISDGLDDVQLGKVKMNARAYCSRFAFSGTDQQKKVRQLSGGERNRVHLARMLKEGANVLLLDEPTNDLDVKPPRCGGHAPLHPPCRRSSLPSPHARAGEAGRSLGALSRTPSSSSPAVSSSSPTTAGSSTASRPTSSPSRATPR